MDTHRIKIECGVSFRRRAEMYNLWYKQFLADLVPCPTDPDAPGLVRSYDRYVNAHDRIYGPVLPKEQDAAFRASQVYRSGMAQVSLDAPGVLENLRGHVDFLGEERKLHLNAIATRLDGAAEEAFVRGLYRACDEVWKRFHDDSVSYVIWNTMLRKDGVGLPAPRAMAWHYDTHCPKRYFKFLIGLNASEDHGGGTELLSPEDSARFTNETGYVGYRGGDRISEEDFNRLSTDSRIVFRPNLGDTLLFWPSRVLHRGLLPQRGQRLMLFVSACPISESLASKREALTRMVYGDARKTPLGFDFPLWWGHAEETSSAGVQDPEAA